VDGDPRLVKLCHSRMMVEHVLKSGKGQLNLDNLRGRGAAKVRMHIAPCYSTILAAAITAPQDAATKTRTHHKSVPVTQR